MSDANRTKIAIVKEVTPGTTPGTPAFEQLRVTGANLAAAPRHVISNELRSDRQVTDAILVSKEAGGGVPMETAYGTLDTAMEGAMMSTWSARWLSRFNATAGSQITGIVGGTSTVTFSPSGTAPVAGDIFRMSGFTNAANNGFKLATAGGTTTTLVATGGGFVDEAAPPINARLKKVGVEFGVTVISATATTLVRSAGSWITDGIVVGEWLKAGGAAVGTQFATAAMASAWVRVSAVAALTLTLDIVPTGWTTDAGTGKTIRIFYGDYIRNGTTRTAFTIEETFEDLTTPEYHYYTGQEVNTLQIEAGSESILTAALDFVGMGRNIQTTRFAGSTDIQARDNDVLNASSNVGRISENGVPLASPNYVVSTRLEVNNNKRRKTSIGSIDAWGIGSGRCVVTGSLGTYYGSKALLDKLLANTASSYDVRFVEPDGSRALLFDCPKIKFMGDGAPTVSGIDTDRMLELGFQALRHGTYGYTIEVMRFEGIEGV